MNKLIPKFVLILISTILFLSIVSLTFAAVSYNTVKNAPSCSCDRDGYWLPCWIWNNPSNPASFCTESFCSNGFSQSVSTKFTNSCGHCDNTCTIECNYQCSCSASSQYTAWIDTSSPWDAVNLGDKCGYCSTGDVNKKCSISGSVITDNICKYDMKQLNAGCCHSLNECWNGENCVSNDTCQGPAYGYKGVVSYTNSILSCNCSCNTAIPAGCCLGWTCLNLLGCWCTDCYGAGYYIGYGYPCLAYARYTIYSTSCSEPDCASGFNKTSNCSVASIPDNCGCNDIWCSANCSPGTCSCAADSPTNAWIDLNNNGQADSGDKCGECTAADIGKKCSAHGAVPSLYEECMAGGGSYGCCPSGLTWDGSNCVSPTYYCNFGFWTQDADVSQGACSCFVGGSTTPNQVTQSSSDLSIFSPHMRKSFYANGRYWVFYSNGINGVYRTSNDGSSWGSETTFRSSINNGDEFSVFFDGTYLHYAYSDIDSGGGPIYYRRGTPNSNGTITWSAAEQTAKAGESSCKGGAYSCIWKRPNIAVDSGGYPWIGYAIVTSLASYDPWVTKSSTNNGTWSTDSGFPYLLVSSSLTWHVVPVPLTDQKVYMIYGNVWNAYGRLWTGSWSSSETIGGPGSTGDYSALSFSAVNQGDDVHVVWLEDPSGATPPDIKYRKRTYGTGWEVTETVQSGLNNGWPANSKSWPVLSIDTTNNTLYCFWLDSPTPDHIYYKKRVDGVWDSSPTDWVFDGEGLTGDPPSEMRARISSYYKDYGGKIALIYMTKGSSPYNIKQALVGSVYLQNYWNLGGDISNCCQVEKGEYKLIEKGATDGVNSDACCDAPTDCVDDDTCYPSGSCHDTDSGESFNEYCSNNIWFDNDDNLDACNACVGPDNWNLGGEIPIGCCGDDPNESKRINNFDSDDIACCSADTDCVYDGVCYADGESIILSGFSYVCSSGSWINYPPVASIYCDATNCGTGSSCDSNWIAYNNDQTCEFYLLNQSTDQNSTNPPDNNSDIKTSKWWIFYQDGTPWNCSYPDTPIRICSDNPSTPENEAACDLRLSSMPSGQSYYAKLRVEDTLGENNEVQSKNFYIRQEATPDFECSFKSTGEWQDCQGLRVSEDVVVYFKDKSSASEGGEPILHRRWNFGDGTPSQSSDNQTSLSATFKRVDSNSGEVSLEIEDAAGRIVTKTYQLMVSRPLPLWKETSPLE